MLPIHVALVAETTSVSVGDLTRVAAALQKQVTRDFTPLWHVEATVNAFTSLDDMPADYWPIIVKDQIVVQGPTGVHDDWNGQPFALIRYSDSWSLAASHETLEMLADPTSNRLVAGQSPELDQGRVQFLVELCDPCQDAQFAYTVNGILVSDFITPNYEDPLASTAVRYSYTGAIKAPRQVLKGGYLSWQDADGQWWQRTYFSDQPQLRRLDAVGTRTGSLRSWVDSQTSVPQLVSGLKPTDEPLIRARSHLQSVETSTSVRATQLRAQIERLRQ
jgi:hypothetical protein